MGIFQDRSLKIWDLAAEKCVQTLAGHDREIFCADTDSRADGGMGGNLIISGVPAAPTMAV